MSLSNPCKMKYNLRHAWHCLMACSGMHEHSNLEAALFGDDESPNESEGRIDGYDSLPSVHNAAVAVIGRTAENAGIAPHVSGWLQ